MADFNRSAGQAGGEATKAKHGSRHFQQTGGKGGRTTAARRGPEYMKELGRKGGLAAKARRERAAQASEETPHD